MKTVLLLLCMVYLFRSIFFDSRKSGSIMAPLMLADTKQKRLPQAIIIGSRKAGTRALLKFLELNPAISAASNEVHFFDRNINRGYDWYREQMPESELGQVTIEKSPAYFVTSSVPERIRSMNCSIKLILILRDPVTRLISDFSQLVSNRIESLDKQNELNVELPSTEPTGNSTSTTSLEIAWKQAEIEFRRYTLRPDGSIDDQRRAVKIGEYSRYLEKWQTTFSMNQIHLVDGENMIKNPQEELRRVEDFLGIRHAILPEYFIFNPKKGFYCIATNKSSNIEEDSISYRNQSRGIMRCLSKNKGRRHVLVDEALLSKLRSHYKPYNEYLFSLMGKKFDWK